MDDNPFDDLEEEPIDSNETGSSDDRAERGQDVDQTAEQPSPPPADSRSQQNSMREVAPTTDRDRASTRPDSAEGGRTLAESTPGFSFDSTTQEAIYPRPQTWKQMNLLKHQIEGELLGTYDIDNVAGREVDEAILQEALEQIRPEAIAARIVANRGYQP